MFTVGEKALQREHGVIRSQVGQKARVVYCALGFRERSTGRPCPAGDNRSSCGWTSSSEAGVRRSSRPRTASGTFTAVHVTHLLPTILNTCLFQNPMLNALSKSSPSVLFTDIRPTPDRLQESVRHICTRCEMVVAQEVPEARLWIGLRLLTISKLKRWSINYYIHRPISRARHQGLSLCRWRVGGVLLRARDPGPSVLVRG